MSHILTPRRPDSLSVEHSIRRADRELQKIELLKKTFRAQVETLITNARLLGFGVTEAVAIGARDSAEDVLSDLFWEIEQVAREECDG